MEAWVEQNSGRWSYNWHHDQKSDEGQDKDSTGLLCLFDFLDPLFLCWKAVILLDVIFLCDSMLALGIRCKVHWCSWRQAFYFKSNQCPLGTWAFCRLLNFKKCAGDSAALGSSLPSGSHHCLTFLSCYEDSGVGAGVCPSPGFPVPGLSIWKFSSYVSQNRLCLYEWRYCSEVTLGSPF